MRPRSEVLLDWYRDQSRDLPWRRNADPYRVMVSEVMLQQTQVERVIPRFAAFVDRFPTVADLGAASLGDVLDLWHGLGYNSRAKRLRDAAAVVAADGWPTDIEGLQRLPGIGPYTAAAIDSIVFGHQVPAVDTNLRRVISRWRGEPLDGADLTTAATEELGTTPAGVWNQAVMDLGATICRPRNPRCGECPVVDGCADPTVYVPPPRQSRFEGSLRQLRAQVLRELADGPAEMSELIEIDLRADEAVSALEKDGMVSVDGDRVALAG
ncbi:MAG: A/G-specific adenine glycosylase [Acidimicrobiia bacterium]|nr:A/G-specific adenine glycosylase [Acidimicrobiia bacterium]